MNRFLIFFAAFLLFVGSTGANTASAQANQTTNDLIAQLPASDAVAVSDMKRLLTVALPQILASKPAELAAINAHLDEFKAKTGIDARQLDRIAIGMKMNRVSPKEIDFMPVAIARGNFNAGALLSVGKIAISGKYREEKIGGKTVLVFSLKDVAAKLPAPQNAAKAERFSKIISRLMTGEVGVAVVDSNTLAFGDVKQVREMFAGNGKNRVSPDLSALVQKNPNAVMSFAGNIPQNLGGILNFDNDEIGRILGSLRQMYGSLDVAGGSASLLLAARAETTESAQDLESTLLGLQMLGSGFLGSRSDEKSKIAVRALEALKIARTGNEIEMRASVPQTDIDKLLGSL